MILLSKHFLGYLCKKNQVSYKTQFLILLLMSSGPVVIGTDLALKKHYLKISN